MSQNEVDLSTAKPGDILIFRGYFSHPLEIKSIATSKDESLFKVNLENQFGLYFKNGYVFTSTPGDVITENRWDIVKVVHF